MKAASSLRMARVPRRQRGLALIMTLVILTVVTILGISAMRAGLLNVAMGTNSQVNMLTFTQADSGFAAVENTVNNELAISASRPVEPGGILSMAQGFERVVCLKKTGLQIPPSPTGREYCDPTLDTDADYVSSRNVAMVQVAIINPDIASGGTPMGAPLGSDPDATPGMGGMLVRTISTSVMPNYGNDDAAVIKACLLKPSDDTGNPALETVTDCLETAGVTYTTLVQEYSY